MTSAGEWETIISQERRRHAHTHKRTCTRTEALIRTTCLVVSIWRRTLGILTHTVNKTLPVNTGRQGRATDQYELCHIAGVLNWTAGEWNADLRRRLASAYTRSFSTGTEAQLASLVVCPTGPQ